jgi:hypothetical protein
MTPMTSTPAARAASASTPISPTEPPPYTKPRRRRASSAATARAAAPYSARAPSAEPQNTHSRFTAWQA